MNFGFQQQQQTQNGGMNQQMNMGGVMNTNQTVGPNGQISQSVSIDSTNLPPPKQGEPGYGQQNPGKIEMNTNFGGF